QYAPDQEAVHLRQRLHSDEAGEGQLGRHGHHLLHVIHRRQPRRDRLRVPGQRDWKALHHPHQCLCRRHRSEGDAVPAVVRPHRRLPQLHHLLEPVHDR
ncbi:hypothetical protein ACJX0J_037087, partial [Zea mays]